MSSCAIATCTSTRACRGSTSGGSRRCRSPTSRCSTSSRRRCRGCRSASSGPSTRPSPPPWWCCCRRCSPSLAVLVKLEDRGPVLFRQRRVGRDGVEFEMVKFRSMCVDAEAKLAALKAAGNERTGPLFKMDGGDPRVTRIGRFLRASSLDELPAAAQRAARGHEPRRSAAGTGRRGRRVPRRAQRPPPRPAGHHRAVAGRGPRQPVVRGLPPARPVLRRELVAGPRPRHPARHRRAGPAAPVPPPPSPPADPAGHWPRSHRFGPDIGRTATNIRTETKAMGIGVVARWARLAQSSPMRRRLRALVLIL